MFHVHVVRACVVVVVLRFVALRFRAAVCCVCGVVWCVVVWCGMVLAWGDVLCCDPYALCLCCCVTVGVACVVL